MEALFWISAGVILYVYGGYPLLLSARARLTAASSSGEASR